MRFFCDAMLGGLARWLRAAGYEAAFEHGIADPDLVDRARQGGMMILSSDGGLFERALLRDGEVLSLFVPRHAGTLEQLEFVMRELDLPLRDPRCMACGGVRRAASRDEARAEAPPRTLEHHDAFWRCTGCRRLLWRGTHWTRIAVALDRAGRRA